MFGKLCFAPKKDERELHGLTSPMESDLYIGQSPVLEFIPQSDAGEMLAQLSTYLEAQNKRSYLHDLMN